MWMANEVVTGITPAQKRKIYASAKEIGIDNGLLHEMVFSLAGKEHISDLTLTEAKMVIDVTEARLGHGTKGSATDKQKWLIGKLEKELGWDSNPNRLKAFMKKITGVEAAEWLTTAKASMLIEAMKKLAGKVEKQ